MGNSVGCKPPTLEDMHSVGASNSSNTHCTWGEVLSTYLEQYCGLPICLRTLVYLQAQVHVGGEG